MNKSRMLLSIPCLYGVEHTKECIESVVYKEGIDLLLIDNGAEDSVKRLLKSYENHFDSVKVLHNEVNTFVNPALNQGLQYFLEHPEYEYLILINSDLILYNNWDEVVRKRLAVNPDEICMPKIIDDKLFENISVGSDVVEGTIITGGVNGVFMIMNRKQAQIISPFPSEILIWFGDNHVYDILRGVGYKTVMSDNFLGFHHMSQNVQKVIGISEMIETDKVNWATIVEPRVQEIIKNYNANNK